MTSQQRSARLGNAIVLGLGLAAVAGPAGGTTWHVNDCGERIGKGITTLRYAATHAADNDTVDLSGLGCSVITLTAGEIPVTVDNLAIQTSLGNRITVDAANGGRVFEHTGSGLLNLFGLDLQNGNGYGNIGSGADGKGGCVRSAGPLLLQYTNLTGCDAGSGGAVYASGATSLVHASITGCSIHYKAGIKTVGGAVFGGSSLLVSYSTINGNYSQIYTGGVYAKGAITINHSVLSGNSANFSTGINGVPSGPVSAYPRCTAAAGGATMNLVSATVQGNAAAGPAAKPGARVAAVCTVGVLEVESSTLSTNSGYAVSAFPNPAFLTNSTISGNGGAVFMESNVTLSSSTLAFNGVGIYGLTIGFPTSCILNSYSTIAVDIADSQAEFNLQGTCLVQKTSNNLTGLSASGARLAPLAYHGGPTKTHALSVGSPAVDSGENSATESFDQRGNGYPRFVGSSPDVGAYERQLDDDELYYGGFD